MLHDLSRNWSEADESTVPWSTFLPLLELYARLVSFQASAISPSCHHNFSKVTYSALTIRLVRCFSKLGWVLFVVMNLTTLSKQRLVHWSAAAFLSPSQTMSVHRDYGTDYSWKLTEKGRHWILSTVIKNIIYFNQKYFLCSFWQLWLLIKPNNLSRSCHIYTRTARKTQSVNCHLTIIFFKLRRT